MAEAMTCVVMLASGAGWEASALSVLQAAPKVVVLRRCLDVDDLMACVSSGQVDVALISVEAPGLDAAAISHLRRHGVRPIAVQTPGADISSRAGRIDITTVVSSVELGELPTVLATPEDRSLPAAEPWVLGHDDTVPHGEQPSFATQGDHRVIAVWGPAGAPGRTTVATALAGDLSRRVPTLLVDADPWSASVAQHLGVLDEVSGILSAARLSHSGELAGQLGRVVRGVRPGLGVVTGLPRPDRWVEVKEGTLTHLVEVGQAYGHLVLDTGFSLEPDPTPEIASLPGRNTLTLEALAAADEIVVVAGADPVGLARAARGLAELREISGGTPLRVVVNRMRPSLGWHEPDIAAMIHGFAHISGLHFLAEDAALLDRCSLDGRGLIEPLPGEFGRTISALVDALVPLTADSGSGSARRRGGRGMLTRRRTA